MVRRVGFEPTMPVGALVLQTSETTKCFVLRTNWWKRWELNPTSDALQVLLAFLEHAPPKLMLNSKWTRDASRQNVKSSLDYTGFFIQQNGGPSGNRTRLSWVKTMRTISDIR